MNVKIIQLLTMTKEKFESLIVNRLAESLKVLWL